MTNSYYERLELYLGFKFPKSLMELLGASPIPYFEPWYFIFEFPDNTEFWLKQAKVEYPDRNIIPFAKYGNTEDVVCFDGSDTSSDPKVYLVHFGASSGWEDRGFFDNFDEWLKVAKQDSENYKRLMEEEV